MMKAGAVANVYFYNILVQTCSWEHDVTDAEHWLFEMIKAGAEANIDFTTFWSRHVLRSITWPKLSTGCSR